MAKGNVQLAEFYERRDGNGVPYLSGRLGTAQVRLLPTGLLSRGDPVWKMVVSEFRNYVAADAEALAAQSGKYGREREPA